MKLRRYKDRNKVRLLASVALLALSAVLTAQQAPPDRSRPPQIGTPPPVRLPTVQKRQLSNGVPVWLVELHEVPVAQVNLVVLRGSADDPADKFGVATLTASMLLEGAGSRSSLELADAIDFLGADVSAAAGIDSSAVRLHVPVARLADALPLMADVALRPTFPDDELNRLRQERLTSILQARDNPATINATAFNRVLYGSAHRYGTSVNGTAATLKAFTTSDLRAFYATAFQPANAALIVVGDVTMEKVLPLLESSFGGWKTETPARPSPTMPVVPELQTRTVYIVDKPGAPQSQIRIGWVGVARSTPDYFPIQVANTILGGSFSSRLNLNLRERNGYTYGASSGFDMRASAGPFLAAAGVQTDKTSESLTEFFNELNGMLKAPPPEELSRAKNYISLRYPSGFETTTAISRQIEDAIVYRLPDDYFSKYVPSIEAVTAADVQRVADKYIHPARAVIVITGDRKVIEPGIQALKLGEIKVLTIDDVFGPAPAL
ncbi:MAG TPA: pitrilysin family protein [Vicinamibacterales bacterium]|jgi:predicted Zn-dependent peptidase|nr:pitrilysin family protein [Vicinamibacterales bacterium]